MQPEDLLFRLADNLYSKRRLTPQNRILVFTPAPPQKTGVAHFELKLHSEESEKYDLISDFSSAEEYQNEIQTHGNQYNVFPYSFYREKLQDLPYLAKIFVLGNNFFHCMPFEEACRTKGEKKRYLYFHEALCHTALMKEMQEKKITPFEYLVHWYPELQQHKEEFSKTEWHQFCHKYHAYGSRAFIAYTGISNIIVNNSRCEKYIRNDLLPEQRPGVKFFRMFHPIEFSDIPPDAELVSHKNGLLIGTFGEASTLKGTDRILEAVRLLNEKNIKCKLLLAGYLIQDYLKTLPTDYSRYCIVRENIETSRFLSLMHSVDIAVQMRPSDHGESSGCIAQLLGAGVPLIVNESFIEKQFSFGISAVPNQASPEEIGEKIIEVARKPPVKEHILPKLQKFSYAKASRLLYGMIQKDCSKPRRNLAFDVSQIISVGEGTVNRDGIFLTSMRILEGLIDSDQYNIFLHCRQETMPELLRIRQTNLFWQQFEVLNNEPLPLPQHCAYRFQRLIDELKLDSEFSQNRFIFWSLRLLNRMTKCYIKIHKIFRNWKKRKEKYQNMDLFFSPMFAIPDEVKAKPGTKAFLLLYDAIPALFPELHPAWQDPDFWHGQIVRSLCRQELYFCVSDSTKNDFIKLTKLPSRNFVTTYLGANGSFYCCTDPAELKRVQEKYNFPGMKKYVFSLCSISPRKNLPFVIKNFIHFVKKNNISDLIFILGGDGTQKLFQDLLNSGEVSPEDLQQFIHPCGYVADDDLAPLYSFAEFFVYLSLYEGFGLPCLEAMQCGCPVIASNTSSIPEVVGDAGILIPPRDQDALVSAMAKIYFNPAFRAHLKCASPERAALFSWEKTNKIICKKMF